MAIREARVTFFNETPFPLLLQQSNVTTGEWEISPPNRIEPDGMGEWLSLSPGWFRGTAGNVAFLIADTDALVGADRHTGRGGCVFIDWINPYVGKPGTGHRYGTCEGLLKSADPTGDYRLQVTASTGSEPMYGWKEAVVGNPFAALGSVQRINYWYRLRAAFGVINEASTRHGLTAEGIVDPPELTARPLHGQPAHAWIGTWKEVAFGNPSFQVTISGPDGRGAMAVRVDNHGLGTSEQFNSVMPEKTVQSAFNEPYWDDGSSPSVTPIKIGSHLSGLKTVAEELNIPNVQRMTQGSGTLSGSMLGKLKPIGKDFQVKMVDCLNLDSERRFELFGDFAPDGSLRRHRVRYHHVASSGKLKADLLLYPHDVIR